MSTSFKPRSPLKLPQENPLISAIKKRLSEFRAEMQSMFSLFDSRFRTEKQRIDAKLKEADIILKDVSKLKGEDGTTPTKEELTALILKYIPAPIHGKTPTEQELLEIIRPLIPLVKDGEDGKPPTTKELVKLIKPLIPKPIEGIKGKDGTEIKPEEIKSKLRELPIKEAWFAAEHILGLRDIIRNLMSGFSGKPGKLGGGGGTMQFITITGTVDGSNTTFTTDRNYTSFFPYWNGQLLDTASFTYSGMTLTLNFAPDGGALYAIGQP